MLEKKDVDDLRLLPLMDSNSIVLFQLFVLEITKGEEKTYRIIYGWCILSTRTEIDSKVHCSDPYVIHKSDEIKYTIYKLSMYNSPKCVVEMFNKLVVCQSLKSAAIESGMDPSKLKFDVWFIHNTDARRHFIKRPIIFNETNTLITRNFHEKYALTSPYKNVPAFTLIVNNLNKTGIFQQSGSEFYPEWKQVLLPILKYLKEETTLPFDSAGVSRFGNIEFINSQCSNEFEMHDVWFENAKDVVVVDHKEISSSKKVKVVILPNKYTCEKKIVVNCFLSNGGQVILDDCKESFHKPESKFEMEFTCEEPISQIAVSVWVEDKGAFRIWYKHSYPLARNIVTNMGMVGTTGVVKSDWLSIIEKSNNKTKPLVKEAEKISRASYSTISVGNYDLDPWVSSDRAFSELLNQLNPPKSEAQFFAKGWDNSTEEHGAISFLEWFKKITAQAQKVVIQDPFYETRGLEFLARTTNSNTSFTVLTCTQVPSEDDDKTETTTEPNRAIRIKKFIEHNPSVLKSLKLNICDIRSTTGSGKKNLLHDRYIFIFENNVLSKGFHLSNSIQNATENYPLLITPIPADALGKVNQHLLDTIGNAEKGVNTKLVQLVEKSAELEKGIEAEDVPADKIFLDELKSLFPSEESLINESFKLIISKLDKSNEQEFLERWATIGHFLAHSSFAEKAVKELRSQFTSTLNLKLAEYLKSTISQNYPVGFSKKEAYFRNAYHTSYNDSFENTLEQSFWYENSLGELGAFGNWGAHYGSRILIVSGFKEYIEVIRFLNTEFNKNKSKDLLNSPLLKLTTVMFNRLVEKLFLFHEFDMIEKSLKSDVTCLKAFSVAGLISSAVRHEPKIDIQPAIDLITANLSVDDALLSICKMLMEHKRKNRELDLKAEAEIFENIYLVLLNHYSDKRVKTVCNYLCNSTYPEVEKKLVIHVLVKLREEKKFDDNFILDLWSDKFVSTLDKFETHYDYSSMIDMTAWSTCVADIDKRDAFISIIEKISKNAISEVRKPFKKESISWDNAFNRLLFIQELMGMILIYNEKNESKIDNAEEISQLIDKIKVLKMQYNPRL